jgi:hypothetical protein
MPAFLFLLKIAKGDWAIWGPLCFHRNFRTDFSISVKDSIGILMGIALDLWTAFRIIAIFTVSILPVHEHRRPFHLLVPSSISVFKTV